MLYFKKKYLCIMIMLFLIIKEILTSHSNNEFNNLTPVHDFDLSEYYQSERSYLDLDTLKTTTVNSESATNKEKYGINNFSYDNLEYLLEIQMINNSFFKFDYKTYSVEEIITCISKIVEFLNIDFDLFRFINKILITDSENSFVLIILPELMGFKCLLNEEESFKSYLNTKEYLILYYIISRSDYYKIKYLECLKILKNRNFNKLEIDGFIQERILYRELLRIVLNNHPFLENYKSIYRISEHFEPLEYNKSHQFVMLISNDLLLNIMFFFNSPIHQEFLNEIEKVISNDLLEIVKMNINLVSAEFHSTMLINSYFNLILISSTYITNLNIMHTIKRNYIYLINGESIKKYIFNNFKVHSLKELNDIKNYYNSIIMYKATHEYINKYYKYNYISRHLLNKIKK